MLEFRDIMLTDKPLIDKANKMSDFAGAEYCFTSSFIWRKLFNTKLAVIDDYFPVICSGEGEKFGFLFPACTENREGAIEEMAKYAHEKGRPLTFYNVNIQAKAILETLYPGRFKFTYNRDYSDYIYNTEDLTALKGKKYHAKKNHINKFLQAYQDNWRFEEINRENMDQCFLMNEEWCKQNECKNNPGKQEEMCAANNALRHFFELELKGGLLWAGDRLVAYTVGEALNSDTFIVHIEKAFADVQGAYPMINREFASHAAKGFAFINREDDNGEEGLRKAKLSYRPVRLEEKYYAVEV